MLSSDIFELRSRIGTALFALGAMMKEVGVKPDNAETIQSLISGLKDPFVVMVAGEVNAGKSMLLNALFGAELSETNSVPTTDRVLYFRHGEEAQTTDHAAHFREIRLPHAFLHDFHLVDTPGVNSIADGHEKITLDFLPRADVVLFVLPITNPWGARSWELLSHVHERQLKRIILVLQQSDLRTPAEVDAIAEHVRLVTQKRLGQALPTFPVSASRALLGRTTGVDKAGLLAESRMAPLEHHLNEIMSGTESRKAKLQTAVRSGKFLQHYLLAKLAELSKKLQTEGDALLQIATAARAKETEVIAACQPALQTLAMRQKKSFSEAGASFLLKAQGALGMLKFPGTKALEAMEEILTSQLTSQPSAALEEIPAVLAKSVAELGLMAEPATKRKPLRGSGKTKEASGVSPATDIMDVPKEIENEMRECLDLPTQLEPLHHAIKQSKRQLLFCLALSLPGIFLLAFAMQHAEWSMAAAGVTVLLVCLTAFGFITISGRGHLRQQTQSFQQTLLEALKQRQQDRLGSVIHRQMQGFLKQYRPRKERYEAERALHDARVTQATALQANFIALDKAVQ